MMHWRVVLTGTMAVALALGSGNALASGGNGNAAAGKANSAVCSVCHGVDGRGTAPNFPALAGQHQEYLEHALEEFKNGTRKNAIMSSMAAPLTRQDIADLAAYYSSLPCDPSHAHPPASDAKTAHGRDPMPSTNSAQQQSSD